MTVIQYPTSNSQFIRLLLQSRAEVLEAEKAKLKSELSRLERQLARAERRRVSTGTVVAGLMDDALGSIRAIGEQAQSATMAALTVALREHDALAPQMAQLTEDNDRLQALLLELIEGVHTVYDQVQVHTAEMVNRAHLRREQLALEVERLYREADSATTLAQKRQQLYAIRQRAQNEAERITNEARLAHRQFLQRVAILRDEGRLLTGTMVEATDYAQLLSTLDALELQGYRRRVKPDAAEESGQPLEDQSLREMTTAALRSAEGMTRGLTAVDGYRWSTISSALALLLALKLTSSTMLPESLTLDRYSLQSRSPSVVMQPHSSMVSKRGFEKMMPAGAMKVTPLKASRATGGKNFGAAAAPSPKVMRAKDASKEMAPAAVAPAEAMPAEAAPAAAAPAAAAPTEAAPAAAAPAAPAGPMPVLKQAGVQQFKPVTYWVKPGDTISTIARQFSLKAFSVIWSNQDIEQNPDRLQIGQRLLIPPVDGVMHTVQPGDTLAAIAAQYKVDMSAITGYEPNRISENAILKSGQQLMIPGGVKEIRSSPAPAAAPVAVAASARSSTASTSAAAPTSAYQGSTSSFRWPVSGRITQQPSRYHMALDIATATGTPVVAADGGRVIFAGWDNSGYGYSVVIEHGNGYRTRYAHFSYYYVDSGTYVNKGDLIGAIGSTGNSTGPHLHFEIIRHGVLQNPWNYLK